VPVRENLKSYLIEMFGLIKKYNKILHLSFFLFFSFFTDTVYSQIKRADDTFVTAEQIDKFLDRKIDSLEITGISLAVINDGKVVYYRVSGVKDIVTGDKVDSNTLFEAASMTKPVFAYTVIRLTDKGLIDLDRPLYKYFTYQDIKNDPRHKQVTARMVLSHMTGLPNWRPKGEKLVFESDPGSKYLYSGEAFEYLGYVVEKITGERAESVISKEVFVKNDIKTSFFTDNDYLRANASVGHTDGKVSGHKELDRAWVSYGMRTEARDYSKFIIMMMKESLEENSTFNKMALPQIKVDDNTTACLGIRLSNTPYGPKYFHSGNNGNRFQSYFEFYRDSQTGFVFFINCNRGKELTKELLTFIGPDR